MKQVQEMTVQELKAVAFDIDQQMRGFQNQYTQVLQAMEIKLKNEAKDDKDASKENGALKKSAK